MSASIACVHITAVRCVYSCFHGTGLSRLLTEKEEEVDRVRSELDSARQATSDLSSQLQEAHERIEQLVSKSQDIHCILYKYHMIISAWLMYMYMYMHNTHV